jgi:ribosomal protein L40E
MRCQQCTAENPEGLKFCNQCGSQLGVSCAKCGFGNASDAKFCGECGASLTPKALDTISLTAGVSAAEAVRVVVDSSATALEGERKIVTVLFADIKGSMDLIQEHLVVAGITSLGKLACLADRHALRSAQVASVGVEDSLKRAQELIENRHGRYRTPIGK